MPPGQSNALYLYPQLFLPHSLFLNPQALLVEKFLELLELLALSKQFTGLQSLFVALQVLLKSLHLLEKEGLGSAYARLTDLDLGSARKIIS